MPVTTHVNDPDVFLFYKSYGPHVCFGVRTLCSVQVVKNGNIPEHDVVVTNPPFSREHVPKILEFCARQGAKPWFLLLPNYVYLKVQPHCCSFSKTPRTRRERLPSDRTRFHRSDAVAESPALSLSLSCSAGFLAPLASAHPRFLRPWFLSLISSRNKS